ncbi:MAG TPA: type II secretion system F family protein, partial [Actinomycetota bacterium]
MSGLVAVLIGLAALFADRGVRAGRGARVRSALPVLAPAPVEHTAVPIDLVLPGVVGVALGAVLLGAPGVVVGAAAGLAYPRLREARRRSRSRALLDEQLADAVLAMAAALRAGMSVPQVLAYAAEESATPLRETLVTLVDDLEVGRPLDAALPAWADAVGTDDARLVASSLELHRRAGGDLPSVLTQVSATIRERVEAAGEVRALTAQARLSGTILGLLPIGFFAFLWITSRHDMQAALATPAGVLAMTVGLGLEV